ncbi:bifunctional nicotinamidase/pyrazinamidase [Roseomonas sp. JC162]|uniref:Nicotinamidase n=1 Tax=Neoroseomonas marina TaxID=1232220 RepID=A0A848EFE4_9PROT|nr:bifunctional nicotinamidase/pyrazinamidase [Neoroseomonas marina]NMJ42163.1 bifunctional nicotinamidase/pyrazinamidase [Neoroseomonas marina]
MRAPSTTALLVVDVQNDFCSGGALSVPHGERVVPLINAIQAQYDIIVVTQDWHPADHASFASQHPGRTIFDTVDMPYGPQVLWPDHCVMGSHGAALHEDLDVTRAQLVLRKGSHRGVDSYSALLEADRATRTGLDGWLTSRGVTEVHVCGLATDFCVAWTALDARRFGIAAAVIEEACRAIDLEGSLARAWSEMTAAGVRRLASADILAA